MSTVPIFRTLPFQEIDRDCLISRNGDVTLAYELTKPPLYSLSAPEYISLNETWTKAIHLLANGTILHLQDWYTGAIFQAPAASSSSPDSGNLLANSSDRHFHGRRYQQQRSFLFITRRFPGNRPGTSAMSSLIRPRFVPEFVLQPEAMEAIFAECRQFIDLLSGNGLISARQLEGRELAGTARKTGLLEQYLTLNPAHLEPVLEDIDLSNGSIRVGRKEVVLFTLADAEQLPPVSEACRRYEPYSTSSTEFPIGFPSHLGPLLEGDHLCNQFLVLDDPGPTLKKLETHKRRLQSLAGNGRVNAVTCADIDAYLDHAAQPNKRPCKVHFNVMGWSEDANALSAISSRIIGQISRTGATPHRETVGAPQLWWAALPGNAGDLPVNETFDSFTDTAACWMIPESSTPSSTTPSGIRLGDRHSGIPVNVDLSDEPMRNRLISNRCKFLAGPTGSGKSFFCNLMVHSYHKRGAHIVIVDIGGSYKGLCELVGGRIFEYSIKNPLSFNPFRLGEGEVMDVEKRESLKALLLTLWKKTDEGYLRSEYITLSNMLEGYYQYLAINSGVFPCFDSFYEWLQDQFAARFAQEGVNERNFDLTNFLYVLRPYYRGGEYDYLLNARDATDLLQQRLVIFELDQIKDHPILFPVVTIVIMEVFISKIRQLKGIPKVILLDEAWQAIAKEGMDAYIRYIYKTVRKFYGEPIVVTQEIDDIISSPVVRNTIINMSDCKILLDMSKFTNRFGELQTLLGLTEKDKTMILSLNRANEPGSKYKEVFISLGTNHSRVYRVEVSLQEYLVYTTEESEKVKVQEYTKRHGGMGKGVTALATDIRSGAVKLLLTAAFTALFLLAPRQQASAQLFDIVDEVIKEALETADLKIQQAQTQVLNFQNAEKNLENSMAGGLLDDITGWVQNQYDLYNDYYGELWQVKTGLSTFSKVAGLINRQVQLVNEYKQATAAVSRDPHFSAGELTQILNVYSGILNASIRNTEQVATVIQAYVTQMDDAGRLRIIDETAAGIDKNYADLRRYEQENSLLSLQRAKDAADIATVKSLYGLP